MKTFLWQLSLNWNFLNKDDLNDTEGCKSNLSLFCLCFVVCLFWQSIHCTAKSKVGWKKSQRAWKWGPGAFCRSVLMQPYVRLARIALRNFANVFSPVTTLLASLLRKHACARHNAIFKWYTAKPTRDKPNQDKTADMIAAGTHGVCNSRLWCTNFLTRFRGISRKTPGTLKKIFFY